MITDSYLTRLAEIESNNNPFARNPRSSAKGRFQFIDSTGQQYGISAPFGTPEYEQQEIEAAKRFSRDNYEALSAFLKREPTQGELYLAHQQGPAGAQKILANPDARAIDLLGQDEVLNNGGDANMSAEEFAQLWTSKFEGQETNDAQPSEQGETFNLELPDGTILEGIPAGTTKAQIKERLLSQGYDFGEEDGVEAHPEESTPDDFLTRLSSDISKRAKMAGDIQESHDTGEITKAEEIVQLAGKSGAGLVLDAGGEVFTSALRGLSNITPDAIEDPIKRGAKGALSKLARSRVGQLGGDVVGAVTNAYGGFKEEHPRAATNVEALTNLALVAAPVKAKAPSKASPTVLRKISSKLDSSAEAQQRKIIHKFAEDLVLPKQTAKQKALQATRTTEKGLLGKRVVDLDPEQVRMAETLSTLPLNPKKSVQHNLNIVHRSAIDEADALKAALKTNEVVFPRKELLSRLKEAKEGLTEDLILNGNTAKQADIIVNNFEKILKNHPSTGSGLLAARKEFDGWLKSKKAKVFTGNSEGAFEIGSRRIRNLANDFLDEKATNVAVKDSLRKQSNLFKSVDVMADKAAAEARTSLGRAVQKITSVIPVRGELMQNITALGLVAGAGQVSAPIATGLGGLYIVGKGGQMVLSPTAKKTVSGLIKKADEAIKFSKDKQLIENLRLDRAALVELLKEEE